MLVFYKIWKEVFQKKLVFFETNGQKIEKRFFMKNFFSKKIFHVSQETEQPLRDE